MCEFLDMFDGQANPQNGFCFISIQLWRLFTLDFFAVPSTLTVPSTFTSIALTMAEAKAVKKRNVLVVGKTGAWKSTVANKVLGQ